MRRRIYTLIEFAKLIIMYDFYIELLNNWS